MRVTKRKLIKNGIVITMDPKLGTFMKADVLVEGSKIRAIQPNMGLDEAGVEVLDASGMIVMPGLIDTHRHIWEALIRNVGPNWSLQTYLNHIYYGGLGATLRPEDMYVGNLLGAVEAINAGVTTLLDWSTVNSPDHADALIRALQESGVRAVFAHGAPTENAEAYWNPESQLLHPAADARRVKKKYFSSDDQLLTMGLAIRGPEFSSWEAALHDIALARELNAICSMHLGFGNWGMEARSIQRMQAAGLLGPDLNFVHVNKVQDEAYRMAVASGASISVTPEIEMMMGHGYPITGKVFAAGGRPALGVDVVTSTAGDMFTQMKFALQAERAIVNEAILARGEMPQELALSAEQILECATVEGARALGLSAKTGSLTPGKEADLILMGTTEPNLIPVNDLIGAVTLTAHPNNVDTVMIGGRILKRNGKLTHVNLPRLIQQAYTSRDYVFSHYDKL